MWWREAAAAILSVVFPAPCPGCAEGGHGGRLCDGCWNGVERLDLDLGCTVCGEPLAVTSPGRERLSGRCGACLNGREFARAVALGPLEGRLHELVLALKFGGRAALAYDLGRRAGAALAGALGPVDVVVAVPLGRARERERGYNQAALLADGVAMAIGGRRRDLLRRVRETAAQTGLTRAQRLDNVRGAFRASAAARGLRVLLVDDVLTTGATVEAAARALRSAGAAEVQVLALARAGSRRAGPETSGAAGTGPDRCLDLSGMSA